MRYLLLAILGMLLNSSCDGGATYGSSGPVVEFSVDCENGIQCAGDTPYGIPGDEPGVTHRMCRWDCAIYTGKEKVSNSYVPEGPAFYMVTFRPTVEGCWELDEISRMKPNC